MTFKEEAMSGSAQVFPIEFQGILIPQNVKNILVSVGLDCPQDGCARRGISLTENNGQAFTGEVVNFFEHETEGMLRDDEDEYAEVLIKCLMGMGFREEGRDPNSFTQGRFIRLSRVVA